MTQPKFQDLSSELQKIFDPEKAKVLPLIAKGAAPLPPPVMVTAWCYLIEDVSSPLADTAKQSLLQYPEKMLVPVLQSDLPGWALYSLGKLLKAKEAYLEAILLNEKTPDEFFLEVAGECSEALTQVIVNNQERIIERPEIVKRLEANPNNLKSNTDRLRHFLKLSGIRIPGEDVATEEVDLLQEDSGLDQKFLEAIADGVELVETGKVLTEAEKLNLVQFISKLSIGGRIKLAMKGNKEARSILIRDSNKLIAIAVLKSPRITENEVAHYTTIKSLSEDVVRTISVNPAWTKNYGVKLGLCFHPKTPLQYSISGMKFLTLRDLQKLCRDKNIPGPLTKAAKQLLNLKRK